MPLRGLAAIVLILLLGACAAEAPVETPAMYVNMAEPGAKLDPVAAASMISQYRANNGLGSVEVDPELTRLAEVQSQAMAAKNKLDHDAKAPLAKRLNGAGYPATQAVENVSAGYHTLAEAFSGWRNSPSHNKNMLLASATKIGIATAYAPKSKYQVYWALVLAEPDDR